MKVICRWCVLFFVHLIEMAPLVADLDHTLSGKLYGDEDGVFMYRSADEEYGQVDVKLKSNQKNTMNRNFKTIKNGLTSKAKLKQKFKMELPATTYKKAYIDMTSKESQIHYLIQYDYIDTCEILGECQEMTISNMAAVISRVNDSLYMEGIRRLQTVWGLDVTGYADFNTRKLMLKARCGNADTNLIDEYFPNLPHRVKRYKVRRKWRDSLSNRLTWMVGQTIDDVYYGLPASRSLSLEDVRPVIKKAVEAWMHVTETLKITEGEPGTFPDIYIYWGAKDHGDKYPFDGPGKVLAHCFYPPFGDLHYDDDEPYVIGCCQGKRDVFQITIHELGHGIGLDHSKQRQAIMFPYYNDKRENPSLGIDDITGAQEMYGIGEPPPTTPSGTVRKPLTRADFCTHPGVNAAFARDDGLVWFIRDHMIVRVGTNGILNRYPQYTSDYLQGLNEDTVVDATLFLPPVYKQRKCSDSDNCYIVADQGGLYVFVQQLYYFFDRSFNLATTNFVAKKFEGVPNVVGGAFTNFEAKIIIVKSGQYYQLDRFRRSNGRYLLDPGFPKDVSQVFTDISGQVIGGGLLLAVASETGVKVHNFIFTGSTYRRYTGSNKTADELETNSYPRSINSWWFDCHDSESNLHEGVFELTGLTIIRMPDIYMNTDNEIIYAVGEDIKSAVTAGTVSVVSSSWLTLTLGFVILYCARYSL